MVGSVEGRGGGWSTGGCLNRSIGDKNSYRGEKAGRMMKRGGEQGGVICRGRNGGERDRVDAEGKVLPAELIHHAFLGVQTIQKHWFTIMFRESPVRDD